MKPLDSNQVKIEKTQLKISLHAHSDGALNADEKWSKNYGDLMRPNKVITPQK